MTPLTTRTLCGWLVPVAFLQLAMAWEADWRRARVGSVMFLALPVTLGIQLARFSDEVDWGTASLWVLLVDIALVAAACLYLWATAGGRRAVAASGVR